jgi:hypothetical protein
MAKSFVVTNRKKLDAFLRSGGQLEDLEVKVGQLTGRPKYAPRHVGSKSRDKNRQAGFRIRPSELRRRSQIRGLNRQLEGMGPVGRKRALKELKAAFKADGGKASEIRTLGRRTSARTPVARVAGVMTASSGYHINAIVGRRGLLGAELQFVLNEMKRGRPVARGVQAIGRNSKEAVRRSLRQAGHFDTGRLLRNTQFEITSIKGKAAFKAAAKANPWPARISRNKRQAKRRATKRRKKAEARRG